MNRFASLVLATAALAACLSPAAQARDSRVEETARKLEDPMTQYMVAGALAAITKQLLEMRVEPFVKAMNRAGAGEMTRDLPPDATLGDLAGPQAERLPSQIMQRVPRLMDSLAELANAYGDMLPELEALAKRMKERLPAN